MADKNSTANTVKVVLAAFLAFFCIILGLGLVFSGNPDLMFFGSLFAASGATFFFVFFFKKS